MKLLRTTIAPLLGLCFILLSGCRFGNHQEPQPTPDTMTGYYVTQPKALKLYATLNDTTIDTDGDVATIPPLVKQFMTNPVLFAVLDEKTGLSAFAPASDPSKGLPIYLKPDKTLAHSFSSSSKTHWIDPGCKSYLTVSEAGVLNRDPSVASPPGNTRRLSGSVSLNIQISFKFQGNCADTFESLARCYVDETYCEGEDEDENLALQQAVIRAYGPWVNSGLITPSQIADLRNYAYEVSYE